MVRRRLFLGVLEEQPRTAIFSVFFLFVVLAVSRLSNRLSRQWIRVRGINGRLVFYFAFDGLFLAPV